MMMGGCSETSMSLYILSSIVFVRGYVGVEAEVRRRCRSCQRSVGKDLASTYVLRSRPQNKCCPLILGEAEVETEVETEEWNCSKAIDFRQELTSKMKGELGRHWIVRKIQNIQIGV